MDRLLAQEELKQRSANRAHRAAVRRFTRNTEETKKKNDAGERASQITAVAEGTSLPSEPGTTSPAASPPTKRLKASSALNSSTAPDELSTRPHAQPLALIHLCPPRRAAADIPASGSRRPLRAPSRSRSSVRAGHLSAKSASPCRSSAADETPITMRLSTPRRGETLTSPSVLPFPSAAEHQARMARVTATVVLTQSTLASLTARNIYFLHTPGGLRPSASPGDCEETALVDRRLTANVVSPARADSPLVPASSSRAVPASVEQGGDARS